MAFPLEEKYVNAAQAALGRALPLGYVVAMCRENGGAVRGGPSVWQLHPIADNSDRRRLKRTCNHILRETNEARSWPGFPPDGLAIGANGGGDVLVLLPDADSKRYFDAVYWWDHETATLHQIADTFEELKRCD